MNVSKETLEWADKVIAETDIAAEKGPPRVAGTESSIIYRRLRELKRAKDEGARD